MAASDVAAALERVLRQDRGRLMAALVARLGSFQLAEDALQEASVSALSHWGRNGAPAAPLAWLLKVAHRKALDRLRKENRAARREDALARTMDFETVEAAEDIPDERLRLIFACCHPALEEKSRVALTLRAVCGLSTAEIARAFLDAPATMGQRLSRAKAKIAAAGVPFAVPEPDLWDERLQGVLTAIYLIFTAGYTAGPGEPRDLCGEAIFLARLLVSLHPDEPEIEGALALMLLTDARRAARTGPDGATVPPAAQDRALWNRDKLAEGRALLERALNRRRAGPFQVKAAIGACQMADPGPDWPQIVELYAVLLSMEPTPVVRLNLAVALAETGAHASALAMLDEVRSALADFQPFQAARAAVLAMAGKPEAAARAYETAIRNAQSEADRLFLKGRLAAALSRTRR